MKKNFQYFGKSVLILLLTFYFYLFPFTCLAQQWVPDTNKKFSLRDIGAYGNYLYSIKDTLYFGGHYHRIGNVKAFQIARYYNGRWDSLRGGVYGEVYAMQYYKGYLYIGGNFICVFSNSGGDAVTNGVHVYRTFGTAKWDGNHWYSIDTTVDCSYACVNAIKFYNNMLIFGSSFNLFGKAWGVIAWDGTHWIKIGELPHVLSLGTFNNKLYAGCPDPQMLAEYLGDSSWTYYPLNCYYSPGTKCMFTDTINNFFYIGGIFAYVDNPPVASYGTAMWDGFQWHSMGTYLTNMAHDIKLYHGYLYAVMGCDTFWDGSHINYIGRWDWDSLKWHPLTSGLNSDANSLEVFHDTLFVAGHFTIAGGDSAIGLARWYAPPDTNCAFLRPMIHTLAMQDTFYLSQGHVDVQFYNNNSYANAWQWDFGDGSTSNTKDPIHTYTDTGIYTVSVTVTHKMIDDTTRICTKTATKTIVVLHSSGIDTYTEESLHFIIYPNPTTGEFTVECTLPPDKTGLIKIYNSNGSFLREFPLESDCNHLVIPDIPWFTHAILCGLYIDGKQVLVEKVVRSK